MARHRGVRDMMDDYDDLDDFDPMDDDESNENFYITQVIAKTGAMDIEKVLRALRLKDWDIEETVKYLKPPKNPQPKAPPNKVQGPPAKNPQSKNNVGKNLPNITPKKVETAPKIINNVPSTSVSETHQKPVTAKFSNETTQMVEESKKGTINSLNIDYPDVNSEV